MPSVSSKRPLKRKPSEREDQSDDGPPVQDNELEEDGSWSGDEDEDEDEIDGEEDSMDERDADEESDDMDGEKPRAAAWQDDEEREISDSESSEESENDEAPADDDHGSARLRKLQKQMSSLPFGTLLQAKQEVLPDENEDVASQWDSESGSAPEEQSAVPDKPVHWKLASDRKTLQKRVVKTAPLVETSKRPVSRLRQVVEVKKKEARDPRFSSLFGEFSAPKFAASYSFIGDIQREEAKTLRHTIRDTKESMKDLSGPLLQREERRVAELKRALDRIEGDIKKSRQEKKDREVMATLKKEERDKRASGKKEWHLKEADKRKLLIEAKYNDLAEQGGQKLVKKALHRKQTKLNQQEKRSRPYAKGEFYSESTGDVEFPKPESGRRGRFAPREGRSMPFPTTRDTGWPKRGGSNAERPSKRPRIP